MLAPSQLHTYAIYKFFTLLNHLHLNLSFTYLPKSMTNDLLVPFICSCKLPPSSYFYLQIPSFFLNLLIKQLAPLHTNITRFT